ncbi:MAG: CDP-6-deoxy-delta-3,4-glucoseen reductase [Aquisalimonadaceae bacterium]
MSYQITIEPSGHRFTAEAGESVLDAALRHGLIIPYSCRGGTCGTCMGKIVQGEVGYPGGELPAALDPQAAAVGQALLCQANPGSDLSIEVREVNTAADIMPRKLPCRVARMEPLAHDVMRLLLKLPETERLQFLAGQYIDILLRDGRRRSYSLANAPLDDALLELHVRNVPDGRFSGQVFGEMKEKALLRLEGPLGSFYLREDSDRPILMLAGGTGFAPVKSMLEYAFAIGMDRPIHLYRGARAMRDLYLDALPLRWAEQHPQFSYTPCLSDPAPDDQWQGRIGLVHNMLLQDYAALGDYDIYMSGPPGMIESARRDFADHGVNIDRLFCDSFDYAMDGSPAEPRGG